MKELTKDQVQLLTNRMKCRIDNCQRKAKAYAVEGNSQMSMVASIQAAEVDNILAYLHGLMKDEE